MSLRSKHFLSRSAMMLWSTWLIASVLIAFTLHRPMSYNFDAAIPAIRMLMLMIFVGVHVIWPLFALSISNSPRYANALTFGEWLGMTLLTQFTIWPLWTIEGWTLQRCAESAALMCGWSMILAPIISLARRYEQGQIRWICMTICLCIPVILPIFPALLTEPTLLWRYNPYFTIQLITESTVRPAELANYLWPISLIMVGSISWLFMAQIREKDSPQD